MSSAEPKPPLTSTRLPLPFEQLSPAAFERLWLARREGFHGVEYLGQAGSEQGRDLVARRDGRRFAFQCKRVQRFAAADATREVAKIRSLPAGEQPEELIFVVTRAISAATRKSAREAWGDEETCRFWSGDELDERVKRHPEILAEFFDLGSNSNRGRAEKRHDPRTFRIFLSSTSDDLTEHRERVARAIEYLRQQPVRMETFVAEADAPLAACREHARSADALVVIVAHRYGWVPPEAKGGDGKKSITWHEVEAARAAGKPVFAFLVDPQYAWAGAKEQDRLTEANTDQEVLKVVSAVRGLKAFKGFIDATLTRKTFTTPDDLAMKVTTSLFPWLLEQALGDQASASGQASPAAVDFTPYLEDLVNRTDHIDIRGIGTRHTRGASRYSIERLYTPLSSRGRLAGQPADDAMAADMAADDMDDGFGHRLVSLADLLPRNDRLLIEGQPGAGKTTFLRLAACMLARDLLGEPCPDGGPWRHAHLGLDASAAPKVPVLLRLADLAALLSDGDAPRQRHDGGVWLLDLLARTCRQDDHPVAAEHWRKLFESGDAMLLLDGLDEAAEEGVRRRVFEIVRDAARRWPCPMVITSRPIDTAPLIEMGFHSATIEPFDDRRIRAFIDRWVAALHAVEDTSHGGEAGRYRESLTAAIVGRSRVKRLAANPVMLTCLCVVHWNEGRLPEARSRVYRSVLRWLIVARGERRRAEGFNDLFAEQGFARLALTMMGIGGGKQAVLDLEAGAVAVAPLIARQRPELDEEGRRLEARRWLDFECLGSGIIEEVGGRRLRFWHLTFQEFSAALQLAWRGDGDDPEQDWWPVVSERLDDAQWRETIELLPGCLLESGVGRVDRLLERVLALRGDSADLASGARVAGILGRLLRPLGVLGYKPSGDISAAYDATLKRSMAIFDP
ncbi:MAG: DUF4062 domain-containing protein, partial [Gammaproteobacteria bacterium]|nr:DUF4062 domain-containing protein [Gammaproteobacteria bacterium]